MVRFGATPRTKKKMSGGVSQQFCVRWNSHLGSLGAAFPQLLAGQRFVDVTLACEGHQVHCHRLVLAACSSFFESLLGENPCKHPIIILPRDIKLWEIQALVDFMYKGEVNVSQAGLPDLLKCAEILQIRGLCGSDAALNLNQITTSTPVSTTSNTIGVQHNNSIINKNSNLNNNSTTTNAITTTPPAIHNNNNFINNNIHNVASSAAAAESSPNIITPIIKNVTSSTNIPVSCSTPISSSTYNNLRRDNENSLSAITVQPTIMVPPIDFDDDDGDDDSLNGSDLMDEMELKIKEDYSDEHNTIVKMEPEFAMANVTCEYETVNASGRRVRRSETLLRQAAECVSRGQTFQTVSDIFHIPISTIRFFMARKGILPRRKRGRASGLSMGNDTIQHSSNNFNEQNQNSRSSSPSEPPFHFAHYKLPELKPKLF